MMEYDPEIHITVGQLREKGIPIDVSVPDCAWIDRSPIDGAITFHGPFQWITLNIYVNPKQE
jgi:hypothetical protein